MSNQESQTSSKRQKVLPVMQTATSEAALKYNNLKQNEVSSNKWDFAIDAGKLPALIQRLIKDEVLLSLAIDILVIDPGTVTTVGTMLLATPLPLSMLSRLSSGGQWHPVTLQTLHHSHNNQSKVLSPEQLESIQEEEEVIPSTQETLPIALTEPHAPIKDGDTN